MQRSDFQLDDWQTRFLLSKRMNGVKEITLTGYQKTFMNFEHQTERPMDYVHLLEQTVDFFLKINGYSPMTFNHQRAHLNAYYGYLLENQFIDENPIQTMQIKRRKEEDTPHPAEKDDLQTLLSVIPRYTYTGMRNYVMIVLMADTGIRPAEVVRIKRDSIDFHKGYIRLTEAMTKTGKERITPLSKAMRVWIKRWLGVVESEWEKSDLLFLTEAGKPMETFVLRQAMKRYSEMAGVNITPYQLRHFYGTEYLRNNGNLLYLQKVMGHSNLSTTRKYVQIKEEDLIRSHEMVSPMKNLIQTDQKVPRSKKYTMEEEE